jgi:5-methylcytosine-specific restriction endonuclease McrA
MTILPNIPRVHLDEDSYRQLRFRVLERDGWRCQRCGAMTNLEVHHAQFRSRLGWDAEDNLITLCTECHKLLHTKPQRMRH